MNEGAGESREQGVIPQMAVCAGGGAVEWLGPRALTSNKPGNLGKALCPKHVSSSVKWAWQPTLHDIMKRKFNEIVLGVPWHILRAQQVLVHVIRTHKRAPQKIEACPSVGHILRLLVAL